LHIRFLFTYTALVFNLPQSRRQQCDFTIRCKKCGENIPAPVGTMPDDWIAARCPLCGETRNYLPSEIFRGNLSYKLARKPVRRVVL
jgi:ribosomal protein S27E